MLFSSREVLACNKQNSNNERKNDNLVSSSIKRSFSIYLFPFLFVLTMLHKKKC